VETVVLTVFIMYNIVPEEGKAVLIPYDLSCLREAVTASSPVFCSIKLGRGAT
jgi:hypothetical protein